MVTAEHPGGESCDTRRDTYTPRDVTEFTTERLKSPRPSCAVSNVIVLKLCVAKIQA